MLKSQLLGERNLRGCLRRAGSGRGRRAGLSQTTPDFLAADERAVAQLQGLAAHVALLAGRAAQMKQFLGRD